MLNYALHFVVSKNVANFAQKYQISLYIMTNKKSDEKPSRKPTEQVVRYEQWVNAATGEVRDFAVIDKAVQNDHGFHKVWLEPLAMVLGIIGGAKIKVFGHILNIINPVSNEVSFTQQELAKDCNVSRVTALETVNALVQAKFMKKVRTCVYKVNPAYLVKGNSDKRRALMIIYSEIEDQKALPSEPMLKFEE